MENFYGKFVLENLYYKNLENLYGKFFMEYLEALPE